MYIFDRKGNLSAHESRATFQTSRRRTGPYYRLGGLSKRQIFERPPTLHRRLAVCLRYLKRVCKYASGICLSIPEAIKKEMKATVQLLWVFGQVQARYIGSDNKISPDHG